MDRIAVVTLIVESLESAPAVNDALHEHAALVVGRMGIPDRDRGLSIICVVVSGPQERISALSGRLGRIPDVSVTVAYAKSQVR
jgi:putative iron-only hydrogenase system regulator